MDLRWIENHKLSIIAHNPPGTRHGKRQRNLANQLSHQPSMQDLGFRNLKSSLSPFHLLQAKRKQSDTPYNMMEYYGPIYQHYSASVEKENVEKKTQRTHTKAQTSKIPQPVQYNMKLISERFQKIKFLGKGKYSDVFLALQLLTANSRDRMSQTIIALKIIQKRIIERHRLESLLVSEIKVQSYLKHANILRIYGMMSDANQFAIILESCESSLHKALDQVKRRSISERNIMVYQMISGISWMHQKQVIHRDIKPENILIIQNNIKVSDFGIAHFLKSNQKLKQICGTPGYMAPEVKQGQPYDHKADAYSLGILIKQLYDEKEIEESQEAKDIWQIGTRLSLENPQDRLSVESALRQPAISQLYNIVHKNQIPNLNI